MPRDKPYGLRKLIKLRRTDVLHWTQEEAGKAAGMSKANWRKIESGGHTRVETLARMLYAVGVKLDEIENLDEGLAVSGELQARLDMLPPQGDDMPRFVTGAAEEYLWRAPVSKRVRRYLIMCLRVAEQMEDDLPSL